MEGQIAPGAAEKLRAKRERWPNPVSLIWVNFILNSRNVLKSSEFVFIWIFQFMPANVLRAGLLYLS